MLVDFYILFWFGGSVVVCRVGEGRKERGEEEEDSETENELRI